MKHKIILQLLAVIVAILLFDNVVNAQCSGNIHVDSKNLASGIYSYSLVVDGKIIDTKKMVKSK